MKKHTYAKIAGIILSLLIAALFLSYSVKEYPFEDLKVPLILILCLCGLSLVPFFYLVMNEEWKRSSLVIVLGLSSNLIFAPVIAALYFTANDFTQESNSNMMKILMIIGFSISVLSVVLSFIFMIVERNKVNRQPVMNYPSMEDE